MTSETAENPARESPVRVALTGANSFTGLFIARALKAREWEVLGLTAGRHQSYTGLKARRTQELTQVARLHDSVRAEDGGMAQWIRRHRPDLWIHHHHFMENYRSPAYDREKARQVCVEPLPEMVRALAESGCRGIVYSSTFFEPGEGGRQSGGPVTPYGESKAETWRALAAEAGRHKLPISRVVIANPVGPYENDDRLIPILVRCARNGTEFSMQSAETVTDYIPADELAEIYGQTAMALLSGRTDTRRPSGRVCTVREWVAEVARELLEKRLQVSSLRIADRPSGTPPPSLANPADERLSIDWKSFWDDYAQYFRS